MRSKAQECVWVDHERQVPVTYSALGDLNETLRNTRTGQAVCSILQTFSKVHVCSSAQRLKDILDEFSSSKDHGCSICILVSLDTDSTDVTEQSMLEVSNLAGDYEALDHVTDEGLDSLNGLAMLHFTNLYIRCLRINYVHCAASPKHDDQDACQRLTSLGIDVISNLQNYDELNRLALQSQVSRNGQPKSKQVAIELDSAKYESEDVRPDEQQWEGLRGRINTLVYPPVMYELLQSSQISINAFSPARHDLIDFHMPLYRPLLVPNIEIAHDSSNSQIPRLQQLVSSWNFSTLQLSEQDLVNCAAVIFKHLFSLPGTEEWHLTDEALFSFIGNVRRAYYTTNPYHNFRHAVDVLQAVFYMLLSAAALPQMNETCQKFEPLGCSVLQMLMTPQYMLGACIVGLGHDVGHPGVNNALLVTAKAPISQLYNDRSVLESMHCAALSRILSQKWPSTQKGSMRKVIIELILSTDMALHFDYMSKFKEMEKICIETRDAAASQLASAGPVEIPPATLEKYKLTLFSALIKCGDISNVARPFDISRDWSFVLLKEFFNQARLERSMGLPVTKNFDPEETAQADSQVFFINLFAQPLFFSVEKVLPNLAPISRIIASNHDTWKILKATPVTHVATEGEESQTTSESTQVLLAKPLAKSNGVNNSEVEGDQATQTSHVTAAQDDTGFQDNQNKTKKSFSLQKLFKRKKSGVSA